MKVIDVLEKLANGTLEDGFQFKILDFSNNIYKYKKILNTIYNENMVTTLGEDACLDALLNNEVEIIKDNNNQYLKDNASHQEIIDKINEIIKIIKKIIFFIKNY